MCADSGNRAETAASAAADWQWRRKEWSNAKKIPPERLRVRERQTGEEPHRGHDERSMYFTEGEIYSLNT